MEKKGVQHLQFRHSCVPEASCKKPSTCAGPWESYSAVQPCQVKSTWTKRTQQGIANCREWLAMVRGAAEVDIGGIHGVPADASPHGAQGGCVGGELGAGKSAPAHGKSAEHQCHRGQTLSRKVTTNSPEPEAEGDGALDGRHGIQQWVGSRTSFHAPHLRHHLWHGHQGLKITPGVDLSVIVLIVV